MISVQCPYCSATIKVEEKYLGRRGKCGGCKRPIIMAAGTAKPVGSAPEPPTVHGDDDPPLGMGTPGPQPKSFPNVSESVDVADLFGGGESEPFTDGEPDHFADGEPDHFADGEPDHFADGEPDHFAAVEESEGAPVFGEEEQATVHGDAEEDPPADNDHFSDQPAELPSATNSAIDPEAKAIGLSQAGQHVVVECPHCDVQISISSRFMGRRGRCKTCGGIFRVPAQVPARASEEFDPFADAMRQASAPAMPSDIFSDPPEPPNPFAATSMDDDDESPYAKPASSPSAGAKSSAKSGRGSSFNQAPPLPSEPDIFASEGDDVLAEPRDDIFDAGDNDDIPLNDPDNDDDAPSVLESLVDEPGPRELAMGAGSDSKTNIALHFPRPVANRAPSSRSASDFLPTIIEGIDIFPVALEGKQSLALSGGTVFAKGQKSHRVLLKLTGSNGVVGWSEVTPSPFWSPETCETVVTSLRNYLAPAVVGLPAWNVDLVSRAMDQAISQGASIGQPIAKSAIDMALHDMLARSLDLPLHVFWGTKMRSEIWISYVVSAKSPDDAVAQCRTALGLGYNAIKLALGMEGEVVDREIVAAVADDLPQGTYLAVDANRAYTLEVALRMARFFQSVGVACFEQPVRGNRISAFRELVRMRYLPIAVDETFLSPADLMEYIRADAVDLPVITLQRVGGHGPARRLFHLAEAAGLRVMGGGLAEGDLGMAHCVHSYGAFGVELPCDLIGRHLVAFPFVDEGLVVRHGRVAVPEQPGCGIKIQEELLRDYVVSL